MNIRYRLAKPCDANQLASIYWNIGERHTIRWGTDTKFKKHKLRWTGLCCIGGIIKNLEIQYGLYSQKKIEKFDVDKKSYTRDIRHIINIINVKYGYCKI